MDIDRRIPDYFLLRYKEEFQAWADNLKKIGPVKHIVLKEGRLSDGQDNEEVGPTLRRVALRMKAIRNGFSTENAKVMIEPDTEEDARKIANHVQKMEDAGWPARLFDKEPARAGIPFFPTVHPTKVH